MESHFRAGDHTLLELQIHEVIEGCGSDKSGDSISDLMGRLAKLLHLHYTKSAISFAVFGTISVRVAAVFTGCRS